MIKTMLKKEYIFTNVDVNDNKKETAIKLISNLCSEYCKINHRKLEKAFMDREKIDSTGFGEKLAMPHAKIDGLKNPMIAIFKFNKGIDWNSIDDILVEMAIVLIMPNNDKDNLHLQVLAQLSRKMVHEEFINNLFATNDVDELYNNIIKEMEE